MNSTDLLNSSATPSIDTLHRLAAAELSLPARLAHVGLLLAASMATIVVLSLWLTEPGLPLRTQMAFAAMAAIGLSWTVFAGWTLCRRRVLLAHQRVIAGRMAVIATTMFLTGAVAAAIASRGPAALAACVAGVVMCGLAILILLRARQRLAWLRQRRTALERELGADVTHAG